MDAERLQQAKVYGRGAYPIRIAARVAHLDAQTARRWVEGYDYVNRTGERRHSAPITYLATAAAKKGDGEPVLNFEQLVKAFKDRSLGLPTIKRAAARAQQVYGTPNPFVTKGFRSDGSQVFIDLEAKAARSASSSTSCRTSASSAKSLSRACSKTSSSSATTRRSGGRSGRTAQSCLPRTASSGRRTLRAKEPGPTSSRRPWRQKAAVRTGSRLSPTGMT
jgi:hypothetical protein